MPQDYKEQGLQASLNPVEELDKIADNWRALEARVPHSFFISWSWISSWVHLVQQQTPLYLFEVRKQGELIGLCFLTAVNAKRGKGLLNCKQIQINEYRQSNFDMTSQYNGVLCAPENLEVVYALLLETLIADTSKTELKGWDEILFCSLPTDHFRALQKLSIRDLNWAQDDNHLIWKVPLKPEFADESSILASLKRKSRQQLKQSLKAIRHQWGEIKLHQAKDSNEALAYFDEMAEIHTARWRRVGEEGVFMDQNWSGFHRRIIQSTFEQNKILLCKIDTESGNLLGYLYGFLHKGEALMQQTGFVHSEHNAIRPGYVSHLACMMYCAGMGITAYDFLPDPAFSYKKFFCAAEDEVIRGRLQKRKIKFQLENKVKNIIRHENQA